MVTVSSHSGMPVDYDYRNQDCAEKHVHGDDHYNHEAKLGVENVDQDQANVNQQHQRHDSQCQRIVLRFRTLSTFATLS